MTNHAYILQSLQSYNECHLYLTIELAKHPIEAMEKNRLAAALLYLNQTKSMDKLKANAAKIFDTNNICEVVKMAENEK